MNANLKAHKHPSGFTLVEMLIAIAVIGVMAAIGIVNMMGIRDSANISKDRRNAQNAATLYASARAAGATFSSPPMDKTGIVNELIVGKNGSGLMRSVIFQLPGMSAREADSLTRFLEFNAEIGIIYRYDDSGQ